MNYPHLQNRNIEATIADCITKLRYRIDIIEGSIIDVNCKIDTLKENVESRLKGYDVEGEKNLFISKITDILNIDKALVKKYMDENPVDSDVISKIVNNLSDNKDELLWRASNGANYPYIDNGKLALQYDYNTKLFPLTGFNHTKYVWNDSYLTLNGTNRTDGINFNTCYGLVKEPGCAREVVYRALNCICPTTISNDNIGYFNVLSDTFNPISFYNSFNSLSLPYIAISDNNTVWSMNIGLRVNITNIVIVDLKTMTKYNSTTRIKRSMMCKLNILNKDGVYTSNYTINGSRGFESDEFHFSIKKDIRGTFFYLSDINMKKDFITPELLKEFSNIENIAIIPEFTVDIHVMDNGFTDKQSFDMGNYSTVSTASTIFNLSIKKPYGCLTYTSNIDPLYTCKSVTDRVSKTFKNFTIGSDKVKIIKDLVSENDKFLQNIKSNGELIYVSEVTIKNSDDSIITYSELGILDTKGEIPTYTASYTMYDKDVLTTGNNYDDPRSESLLIFNKYKPIKIINKELVTIHTTVYPNSGTIDIIDIIHLSEGSNTNIIGTTPANSPFVNDLENLISVTRNRIV